MNFLTLLQSTANPLEGSGFLILMVLAMAAMFWFTNNSQKKRDKEAQDMRDSLQVGDEVTTIGGVIGKVVAIKDETFVLETTKDKTHMRFLKGAIRSVDVKIAEVVASESGETENEAPKTLSEKFTALPTGKKILISVVAVVAVAAIGFGAMYLINKNKGDDIPTYSEGLKFETNGNGTCSVVGMGECKDTVVKIPTTSATGETVVSIGKDAFKDVTTITEVVIPESVTTIDSNAFDGCTALATVSIAKSVVTVGSEAFRGCTALKSIVIPVSVIRIDDKAFYGCALLETITFAEGLTEIGYGAFAYCDALKTVVLPTTVSTIGGSAFMGCDVLESVEMDCQVELIDAKVFAECPALKKIVLGESVIKFDATAFGDAESIDEVCYTGTEADWALIAGNEFVPCTDIQFEYAPETTEEN